MTVFLTSTFALAQDYYANQFWPGEYPSGVELMEDLTINGRLIPDSNVMNTESCTLKEKSVYHPWAQKTEATFVTVSEVSSYLLLEDYSEFDMNFSAGTILQELSYLSEGYCLYKVEGQNETFDMTCLEAFTDAPVEYKVINKGDSYVQWFQATCTEGNKVWFELEDFRSRAADAVRNAQITGYGSVQEY